MIPVDTVLKLTAIVDREEGETVNNIGCPAAVCKFIVINSQPAGTFNSFIVVLVCPVLHVQYIINFDLTPSVTYQ